MFLSTVRSRCNSSGPPELVRVSTTATRRCFPAGIYFSNEKSKMVGRAVKRRKKYNVDKPSHEESTSFFEEGQDMLSHYSYEKHHVSSPWS